MRFRSIDGAEPKYLGISGALIRLFNLRAIAEAEDLICITEGEIDAISLESVGLPAVGVPGANSWKRHHARLFNGFSTVLIFGDGDSAGRQFAQTVGEALRNSRRIRMPEGMDVNSVLQAEGKEGIMALIKE